jgi:hypothetical protein
VTEEFLVLNQDKWCTLTDQGKFFVQESKIDSGMRFYVDTLYLVTKVLGHFVNGVSVPISTFMHL